MHRGVVAWILVGAAVLSGLGAATGTDGPVDEDPQTLQERIDPDRVVMAATLRPDGDAVWRVEYRVRLATDEDVAAFEELAADVRANESAYVGAFEERMGATVAEAAATTEREMALENASVTAERRALPRDYGVVTYRFRWTGFAAVAGEEVRAGDALAGLFLDEATTLAVEWPAGYEASAVRPDPDERGERVVRWRGPREFDAGEPRVVARPADAIGERAFGPVLAALATGAVAAALLLALAARRGLLPIGGDRDDGGRPGGGNGPGDGGRSENGLDGPTGPGDDGDAADEADGGAVADATTDAGPPPELLSNEERVLALLEAEGGRVKQRRIAERLDWTAAKTSQVIGDMREAGAVETFRLGRENVVTLPDVGLTDDSVSRDDGGSQDDVDSGNGDDRPS